MATRIKEKYLAEAVPALQQKFGYTNPMQVPRLEKVVINIGLGDGQGQRQGPGDRRGRA